MQAAFSQISTEPGRRVSSGKISSSLPKPPAVKSSTFGMINELFAGPFRACKTEFDQAMWLFKNHQRFIRFNDAGKDLIEKYKIVLAFLAMTVG